VAILGCAGSGTVHPAGKLHRFCTISAPKTVFSTKRLLPRNDLQKMRSKMVQFSNLAYWTMENANSVKKR